MAGMVGRYLPCILRREAASSPIDTDPGIHNLANQRSGNLYMLKRVYRLRLCSSSVYQFRRGSFPFYGEANPVKMASKYHHANAKAHDFLTFVNASPTR
jgi:hypothetical protein